MDNKKSIIPEEWEKVFDAKIKEAREKVKFISAKKGTVWVVIPFDKFFIRNLIFQTRLETIKAVLPEKHLSNSQDIYLIEDDGFNECRQQIIDNLKSNYNIDLE